MAIRRFEDIEAWRSARKLMNRVCNPLSQPLVACEIVRFGRQTWYAYAPALSGLAEGRKARPRVRWI
jgi:hypothetical protein